MILYRENKVDATKASVTGDTVQEYIRIKIFTQAGTKYGHVEVPFENGAEGVSFVIGRTIKPDGSIVKFEGQVLETTVEKGPDYKVSVKTITLPDVQPGCIIEYKYEIEGKAGYVHDRGWTVSREIYTREAQFIYIPNDNLRASGGLTPRYRPHRVPADAAMKEQVDGSYTMVIHDVPGVEEETLMPPANSIEARVEFFYDGGSKALLREQTLPKNSGTIMGKNGMASSSTSSTRKMCSMRKFAKSSSLMILRKSKLRKIYARVLQIRNLGMEDYKTLKETKDEDLKPATNVEEVLTRGYGNGRQINFLFVGLARAAGFDATEEYVLPRSVDISFAPDLKEENALQADVVWVKAGTQEYYLDPGARYYPFGLLPWYETEVAGIRVSKNGGEIVTTSKDDSDNAILVRNADLNVAQDGSVAGTLQVDFEKQYGASLREGKRKEDEAGRTKDIEDEVKEWLPNGSTFEITKIADWDDVEKPVHVEGSLKIPSLSGGPLQRILMPRDVFQGAQAGWFTTTKRVKPCLFSLSFSRDRRPEIPRAGGLQS